MAGELNTLSGNTRLEAFSGGVFAIAVTLPILDLKVPELETVTPGKLWSALAAQWPAYPGFLTSFLLILIIWNNHHGLFRQLHGHSRALCQPTACWWSRCCPFRRHSRRTSS